MSFMNRSFSFQQLGLLQLRAQAPEDALGSPANAKWFVFQKLGAR